MASGDHRRAGVSKSEQLDFASYRLLALHGVVLLTGATETLLGLFLVPHLVMPLSYEFSLLVNLNQPFRTETGCDQK